MIVGANEREAVDRLVAWGTADAGVRALLLTSSRTNPRGPVDALSDYDVVVAVTDVAARARDESWMAAFGRPMVRFRDTWEVEGLATVTRLVIYADGTKIDYSVWPAEALRRVRASGRLPDDLDVGYRVLLDKDALTQGLPPPTYTAHIPAPPTAAEYAAVVEEFWWESSYVAKNLWRDELIQAKYNLDVVMKFECLRRLLEWRIEIDHGWAIKPGAYGRELKKRLAPDTWAALAATYTGPDLEENWQALFRTTALFRRVAGEVAAALGFAYPAALDAEMTAYLERIRTLPHPSV